MLPLLILGFVLALVLILALRWIASAPPFVVLRVLGWTLGLGLLGAFVFLVVTSRLNWALGTLVALSPWGVGLLRLIARGRRAARLAGGGFGPAGTAPSPDPDDHSAVITRFLDMTLSHATGTMTGTVREGPFAGRALDDLSQAEYLDLWRQVLADPESARVLEAWLDRVHPGWQEEAEAPGQNWGSDHGGAEHGEYGQSAQITRAEALAVLGLPNGAGPEEIKAAHRRLIVLVHPDRGGTPYLAARLNQARDLLLSQGTRENVHRR